MSDIEIRVAELSTNYKNIEKILYKISDEIKGISTNVNEQHTKLELMKKDISSFSKTVGSFDERCKTNCSKLRDLETNQNINKTKLTMLISIFVFIATVLSNLIFEKLPELLTSILK